MRVVVAQPILVMDDGAYAMLVHRRSLDGCEIEGATVIRANSWVGWLIRGLAWLGGPYRRL